jgi:signal transduction histidine kinase
VVEKLVEAVSVPLDRDLHVVIEQDCLLDLDVNRIVQVLANLVENSVRHGAGRITLRSFGDGPSCVFHVSDQGGGVSADFEEEMFLPFSHRGDRSDSTGLGLAIARAIVEAHDGSLVYLAARDGESHQFVVTLPRRRG